jgi:nucleoid DNA-binding protein
MNDRITYADLLDLVAEKTEAPKEQVLEMMRGIVEVVRHGLERDGRVVLRGLGRFELRWQEAHEGRNPQTGEAMIIPAHSHVHFRPENGLSQFINRKYAHLKHEMLSDTQTIEATEIEPEPILLTDDSTEVSEIEEDSVPTKKNRRWFWLIPAAAVILLLILLWPRPEKGPSAPDTVGTAIQTPAEPQVAEEDSDTPPEEQAPPPGIPGGEHRVDAGDRLWSLSDKYYQDSYLWPLIYSANSGVIPNPDILGVGENIVIPPLEGRPGSLSSSDKIDIADGYLQVYLEYHRMGRTRAYTYLWVAKQVGGRTVFTIHQDRIDLKDMERVDAMEGSVLIM